MLSIASARGVEHRFLVAFVCIAHCLGTIQAQAITCVPGYTSLAYTVSFTGTALPPGWIVQGHRNDPSATGAAVTGPFQTPLFQPTGAILTVNPVGALDIGLIQTDAWMPPRAATDAPLIAELDMVPDIKGEHFEFEPQHQFGWIYAGAKQDTYCPIHGLYLAASEVSKVRISLRQAKRVDAPPDAPEDDTAWFAHTCPYIDDPAVFRSTSTLPPYGHTGTPFLPAVLTTESTNDPRWGFIWAGPKPTSVWHPSMAWAWKDSGQIMSYGIGPTPFTAFPQPAAPTAWVDPKGAPVAFLLGLGKNGKVTEGAAFNSVYTLTVSAVTIRGCVTTAATAILRASVRASLSASSSSIPPPLSTSSLPVSTSSSSPSVSTSTSSSTSTSGSTSGNDASPLVVSNSKLPVVGTVLKTITTLGAGSGGVGGGAGSIGAVGRSDLAERCTLAGLTALSSLCLLVLL